MSTEREMTEAAARAVGLRILEAHEEWPDDCTGWVHLNTTGVLQPWDRSKCMPAWNPRHSKEQSMDLMAELRISVEHNHAEENRPWVCASIDGGPLRMRKAFVEDVPDESQRADRMRLAILRCAAAQAPAVEIDRERMEKALASETFTLPNLLSESEIVDHFTRAAKEQA